MRQGQGVFGVIWCSVEQMPTGTVAYTRLTLLVCRLQWLHEMDA